MFANIRSTPSAPSLSSSVVVVDVGPTQRNFGVSSFKIDAARSNNNVPNVTLFNNVPNVIHINNVLNVVPLTMLQMLLR
jgi:hypothetical protein